MKILYITEIFPDPRTGLGYWGGGERQFHEVSGRLAKMGHDVTVLTCRFPRQTESDFLDGVHVRRAGLSRNPATGGAMKSVHKVVEYVAETVREALRIQSDIIHCNAYYPILAGRIVSTVKGTPMVSTFHDLPAVETWQEYAGSASLGRAGYAVTLASLFLANGPVIGVSDQTRSKLAAHGKRSVEVIPNGVDLELLDSKRAQKKEGQVLYVGRLVKYKRIDTLIRAFADVADKIPKARLLIVGDGPERHHLESLSEALTPGRVVFEGTVPSHAKVAELYRESSLFVLPSVLEGEGIAAKEAMAASLPVIAMDVPESGVLSFIRDGWNGVLVKPGSPKLLADAILGLLANGALRESLGANGRKTASAWTWEDAAERVADLYAKVLEAGRRPVTR